MSSEAIRKVEGNTELAKLLVSVVIPAMSAVPIVIPRPKGPSVSPSAAFSTQYRSSDALEISGVEKTMSKLSRSGFR